MSERPIKTPCVQVCFVDPREGLCVGCFRTMDELGRWTKYDDAKREEIIATLPKREKAYQALRSNSR